MRKFKNKKGFTIVELVVVIAVIGVLTAVLVPTFITLSKNAQKANMQSFVTNINKALAMKDSTEGKKPTMHDAQQAAKDIGFDIEKITPFDGNDILWDRESNRFVLVNGDDIVLRDNATSEHVLDKKVNLFKVAKPGQALSTEYSNYLAKGTWETTALQNLTTGIDVGDNQGIENISYDRTGKSGSQDVVIRTNSGNLKINSENDSVQHYGIADIVDIEKIAPSSYHEFGTTGSLTIEVGHVEVEEGAYIAQATVTNSASLTTKTTGKVAYLAASETATIEGTAITTTQKQVDYAQVGETSKYTYQENDVEKTALFVTTVDELNAALNGTTDLTDVSKVVLANDLTIEHTTSSSNVIVKVDTTLDLNGYTITCNNQYNNTGPSNSFFFVQNCEFRIVDIKGNGKISYNNTYNCNVDLFIVGQSQMTKNTTLILNSGILEFNSSNSNAGTYCIDVMDNHASYTAAFIMNGGSILCKDSSGGNNAEAIRLYDNGNAANANRNCYVEINNGYITGDIYFQMGLESPVAHVGEDTLVINGGTIIAKRPIRSTQYTANKTARWGYAVITLNGGNIIATEGFGNDYLSYMNIIGTSYGDSSSSAWSNVSSWTAEKIFNITDNR